jgi:hypothetical protein
MQGTIDAAIFQGQPSALRASSSRKMTYHITEYSDRSLTYEKDTLDTFRGILLRGPFNSFFAILVMPNKHHISISSDAGFATGL